MTRLREDPRLGAVEWRDLMELSTAEKAWEATLSLPWLIASSALFRVGWMPLGAFASFLFFLTGLRWFTAAMLAGECFTGFFAVWTVHHDCDPEHELARTQRGWWKTRLTYEMFYHVEHHLFPAVPTARLPQLAARIDRVMPHLAERQVL